MAGFITPLTPEDDSEVTLTFTLPAEVSWRAVLLGALDALTDEKNWQQIDPDTETVEDTVEAFKLVVLGVVIEDV